MTRTERFIITSTRGYLLDYMPGDRWTSDRAAAMRFTERGAGLVLQRLEVDRPHLQAVREAA